MVDWVGELKFDCEVTVAGSLSTGGVKECPRISWIRVSGSLLTSLSNECLTVRW